MPTDEPAEIESTNPGTDAQEGGKGGPGYPGWKRSERVKEVVGAVDHAESIVEGVLRNAPTSGHPLTTNYH